MYRVTLSRNLSITWYNMSGFLLVRSISWFFQRSSEQNLQSQCSFSFLHSKNYYYFIVILNVCSYSPNLFLTYIFMISLTSSLYTHNSMHSYTSIHTVIQHYTSILPFITSYTHISSHSLTHSLTHLVSHIRLYTINLSLKILIYFYH